MRPCCPELNNEVIQKSGYELVHNTVVRREWAEGGRTIQRVNMLLPVDVGGNEQEAGNSMAG